MKLGEKNRSSQKVMYLLELLYSGLSKAGCMRLLKRLRQCQRCHTRLTNCKQALLQAGQRQASGNSIWVTRPGMVCSVDSFGDTGEDGATRLYNLNCGRSGRPSLSPHHSHRRRETETETDSVLCGWGMGGGSWGGTAENIPGNSEA